MSIEAKRQAIPPSATSCLVPFFPPKGEQVTIDTVDGLATIGGCAKILGKSYWAIQHQVKRKQVPTLKLAGSEVVLVRVADVAAIVSKSGK